MAGIVGGRKSQLCADKALIKGYESQLPEDKVSMRRPLLPFLRAGMHGKRSRQQLCLAGIHILRSRLPFREEKVHILRSKSPFWEGKVHILRSRSSFRKEKVHISTSKRQFRRAGVCLRGPNALPDAGDNKQRGIGSEKEVLHKLSELEGDAGVRQTMVAEIERVHSHDVAFGRIADDVVKSDAIE